MGNWPPAANLPATQFRCDSPQPQALRLRLCSASLAHLTLSLFFPFPPQPNFSSSFPPLHLLSHPHSMFFPYTL